MTPKLRGRQPARSSPRRDHSQSQQQQNGEVTTSKFSLLFPYFLPIISLFFPHFSLFFPIFFHIIFIFFLYHFILSLLFQLYMISKLFPYYFPILTLLFHLLLPYFLLCFPNYSVLYPIFPYFFPIVSLLFPHYFQIYFDYSTVPCKKLQI